MRKIKSRLDDVITDRKFDDFPRLYVEAMDMTRDYGIFSGMRQEAKTYSERPDPIPRQQFERRGATAQRDAQLNSSLMEKEGGKVEYVFNAWKSTGSIEALQQVRVFMAQSMKYALMVGGNTGVMQENMLYLQEYDKRVEAGMKAAPGNGLASAWDVVQLQRSLYQEWHVGIFGIDLIVGEEYDWQKACAEFWLGQLLARDVNVLIPPTSALLKQRYRYGYQMAPTDLINDTDLSKRIASLTAEHQKHSEIVVQLVGALKELDTMKELYRLRERGGNINL
jgi:hypothetical protein